jgi:hypothetical protein
MQRIEELL